MIRGLVGYPGQGKTIAMARWAIKDLAKGLPVAANFRLRGADFVGDFAAILDWCASHPNGVLYIDEAGVVLNARNWNKIPFELQAMFMQHRHFGLDLIWGAQRFDQVDKSIRDLSMYITRIEKPWPGWPSSPARGEGYTLVPIFKATTFQMPNTKTKAWDELYFYSSVYGEMFNTSEVKGEDGSDEDLMKWAGKRFTDAGEDLKGAKNLRIR